MRTALLLLALLSCIGCTGVQRPDGQQGMLAVGSPAPALSAVDHRGQSVRLQGGGPTLVFFYPRDGTPGCTREACALRDAWQRYETAKLRVLGVSSDSVESHREFAKEHGLPFGLIADPDQVWSRSFGVPSTAGIVSRRSFLLDGKDRVVKVYEDVDPGVHADEVLKDARALGLVN